VATNLSIDPELIELALKLSGERTKKAAVTKALQEFIAASAKAAARPDGQARVGFIL
jgi:Bacterial antitoxin of type II TA system, VapB